MGKLLVHEARSSWKGGYSEPNALSVLIILLIGWVWPSSASQIRESDVLYDLGCGDGRLLVEVVKTTGARAVCL